MDTCTCFDDPTQVEARCRCQPIPGWFGGTGHVLHFLRTMGADRDTDGAFLLGGEPPAIGIGGQDVVVPAGTTYFIGGVPAKLAAGLRGTSYGMAVVVI